MNDIKELKDGVLCYVLIGDYKGLGTPKIILHEAVIMGRDKDFGYGHGKHWAFRLPYHSKSKKKSRSSIRNGKKGGAPKK